MSGALSLRRRILLLFLYGIGTSFYLLFGGTVMWRLERQGEVDGLKDQAQVLVDFQAKFNISDEELMVLEDQGICTFPDHKDPHWSYTGSVFFALTVITTIGYGETAPQTWGGQLFCFFYSIPGISIAGLWLQNMAGLLADIIIGIVQRLHNRIRRPPQLILNPSDCATAYDRYRDPGTDCVSERGLQLFLQDMTRQKCDPKVLTHVLKCVDTERRGQLDREKAMTAISIWYQVNAELPDNSKMTLSYTVACVVSTFTWMAIFSVIFSYLEGWSYMGSMWFCFVTLSTIGFGDYIPARKDARTVCFFFICGGLGMMGALIGVQTDLFISKRFWLLHKLHQRGWVSTKLMEAHGISVVVPQDKEEEEEEDEEAAGKEAAEEAKGSDEAEDQGAGPASWGEKFPDEPSPSPQEIALPDGRQTSWALDSAPVSVLPLPLAIAAARRRPLFSVVPRGNGTKPPPPRCPPPLPQKERRSPKRKPPPPLIPPPESDPAPSPLTHAPPAPALQHRHSAAPGVGGGGGAPVLTHDQTAALLERLSELEAWRNSEEERRAARLRLGASLLERQAASGSPVHRYLPGVEAQGAASPEIPSPIEPIVPMNERLPQKRHV